MSKEQALEELLKMIKEGNITDYDAELASYRDEKYGYKDIEENNIQEVNKKQKIDLEQFVMGVTQRSNKVDEYIREMREDRDIDQYEHLFYKNKN